MSNLSAPERGEQVSGPVKLVGSGWSRRKMGGINTTNTWDTRNTSAGFHVPEIFLPHEHVFFFALGLLLHSICFGRGAYPDYGLPGRLLAPWGAAVPFGGQNTQDFSGVVRQNGTAALQNRRRMRQQQRKTVSVKTSRHQSIKTQKNSKT